MLNVISPFIFYNSNPLTKELVKTRRIENRTADDNFVSQTDGSFLFRIWNIFVMLQGIIAEQQKFFHFCLCFLHHTVKWEEDNEDNDNIDRDSDVCTIGVQNIMQSYHGTLHNQNKLKISPVP